MTKHITVEHAMTEREHERLLATATDRFERRLSDESATLRESDAATRLEIAHLRVDMAQQFAESRSHSEARHHELLKWSLLFWVGQAAVVAGIVKALT